MSDADLVTIGLRVVGRIRDNGTGGFEAWGEPGHEAIGRFPTYEKAAAAILERDLAQRGEAAK